MKKICSILVAFTMFFSQLINIQALEPTNLSQPSLEEILSKETSEEEVDRIGQSIADERNERASLARTDGELWTYVSKTKVYSRNAIKGKYKIHVDSNTDVTYTVTVSLSSNFSYEPASNVKISVSGGVSGSAQKKFKGPNNEKLNGGNYATHRLFIGITFGEIYKYKYKVTDKYTGNFLRYEQMNTLVGAETFGLNQLMRVNSNGSITVANIDNSATKTYSSLSAYKSALEKQSYTCKNVIYF